MERQISKIEADATLVELGESLLLYERYQSFVAHSKAGALSSFVGVTRDNFDGKSVVRLEYEAYTSMAIKCMERIGVEMQRRWDLCKVAIAHRVGVVEIGHASVIIIASSPHRKDSLEAVAWAIDELKATVPIWKKEFFADGSHWKENIESKSQR